MIKMILLLLLGLVLGVGGDELLRMYGLMPGFMPGQEVAAQPQVKGALDSLPYEMKIGETKFKDKPLFCIEQPMDDTSIYKRCRVDPGFYASFTKGVLNYMVWTVGEGARFQKKWRVGGLSTNQKGSEFLEKIKALGAVNFRHETDNKKKKILTFDAGDVSYRLWLLPRKVAGNAKSELYFHKLETILSF